MTLKPAIALCLGLALVGCSQDSQSAQIDASLESLDHAAQLSSVCSGCHAEGGTALVSLQGRTAQDLEMALLAYKNTPEGSTVMHRLARGYTDEELSAVAAYLGAEMEE